MVCGRAKECGRCCEHPIDELLAEIRRLKAENAALKRAELASELESAARAQKRQAAPFSRGKTKLQPRKSGRKAGVRYGKRAHLVPPLPTQIDEHYEMPLPERAHIAGAMVFGRPTLARNSR